MFFSFTSKSQMQDTNLKKTYKGSGSSGGSGGSFSSKNMNMMKNTNVKVNPSPNPMIKINPSPNPMIKVNPSPNPMIKINPSPNPMIKVNPSPNPMIKVNPSPMIKINPSPSPMIKVNPSPMIKVNPSQMIEKVNPSQMIKPILDYPNNEKKTNKILVLYVYHIYNERVKLFIKNCIFYDENIDFIIISNNKNDENNNTLNEKNFQNKNVKTLFRENVGYDFGGWSDALLTDNLYEKYNNFIFANSSVIGPFLPSDYKGKWTDIYINGLQGNVKLFGSTINTELNPLKMAHVQSYIFSMDKTTLKFLIDCSIFSISNYAKTFYNAIYDKEILMSTKILENNWNIGSLMKYYKNVDFTFRNKKPNDYNIDFLNDVMYPQFYIQKTWNEYELVFIKGNRNIQLVSTETVVK